jgi:hypothetical protein
VEVKAFTSPNQQFSFTPTQKFDLLYVLDCTKFLSNRFTIHRFEITSDDLKQMRVGMDNTTVEQLCREKRNIRIGLKKLQKFSENSVTETFYIH